MMTQTMKAKPLHCWSKPCPLLLWEYRAFKKLLKPSTAQYMTASFRGALRIIQREVHSRRDLMEKT